MLLFLPHLLQEKVLKSDIKKLLQKKSTMSLNTSIHQTLSSIAFKIFASICLSTAMIISIVNLSQDLHSYLAQYQNGDLLQMGIFCLILIMTSLGLYFLLMSPKTNTENLSHKNSSDSLLSLDLRFLGIQFIEGFLSGLTKQTEINSETNKQKETQKQ